MIPNTIPTHPSRRADQQSQGPDGGEHDEDHEYGADDLRCDVLLEEVEEPAKEALRFHVLIWYRGRGEPGAPDGGRRAFRLCDYVGLSETSGWIPPFSRSRSGAAIRCSQAVSVAGATGHRTRANREVVDD